MFQSNKIFLLDDIWRVILKVRLFIQVFSWINVYATIGSSTPKYMLQHILKLYALYPNLSPNPNPTLIRTSVANTDSVEKQRHYAKKQNKTKQGV